MMKLFLKYMSYGLLVNRQIFIQIFFYGFHVFLIDFIIILKSMSGMFSIKIFKVDTVLFQSFL